MIGTQSVVAWLARLHSHPLLPAVVCKYACHPVHALARRQYSMRSRRSRFVLFRLVCPSCRLSPSPRVERLEPSDGPRTVLAYLDESSALARIYADWLRSGQADVSLDTYASNVRIASASARGAGKGLFATRSFQPGDLILTERALVRCCFVAVHLRSAHDRAGTA